MATPLPESASRVQGHLLGEPIQKASPDFVRESTGFAIGGVPPMGHSMPSVTFIDAHLLSLSTIWAAAGTPTTVFALAPDELVRLTGGRVASVGREPGGAASKADSDGNPAG